MIKCFLHCIAGVLCKVFNQGEVKVSYSSMPTLPDHPGVYWIQAESRTLPYHTKIHFPDIFWQIFCQLGKYFDWIFDELLRFSLKISTLNNFLGVKKGNIGDLPDFDFF